MRFAVLCGAAALALAACKTQQPVPPPPAPVPPTPQAAVPLQDYRENAVLWFATSAEAAACFWQGYAAAEAQLKVRGKANGKQVIVTDLDETAISNAASSSLEILSRKEYVDSTWEKWVSRGAAVAVPGAVEFFKAADKLGYRISYLSNRAHGSRAHTLRNLQALGFPQADTAHLSLRTSTSSKEARRMQLRKQGYEIVMLLGDNLTDFIDLPKTATEESRMDSIRKHAADWGRKFIVFPNPMYGSWYSALVRHPEVADSAYNERLLRMRRIAQPAGYSDK